jgi:hypothetical protein
MATRRSLLTALCFLLLLPSLVFATSIVTIVGDQSITIAADGVLVGNSVETGESVRVSFCKISCVDSICFAASGRYGNKTIGYDVWRLAQTELHRAQMPKEVSERFNTVIAPLVPRLVAVSKKETPDQYAEWLKGRPVLGYLFAGFEGKGQPVVVSAEAMLDSEGRVLPIRESFRRGKSGIIGAVLLGWNQHIVDFMNRNPTRTASAATHPSEIAERMVRMEIQASKRDGRRDVGEPIAILKLTAAKGFSVERKGACQEN